MYEGYTHMANIYLSMADKPERIPDAAESIWTILDESAQVCEGGITRLTSGDLAVRIFGCRSQTLLQTAEKIKNLYEKI